MLCSLSVSLSRMRLTRSKVNDRLSDAMIRYMFAPNDAAKEDILKQTRQAFKEELARNDPENELVIYQKARRAGQILPCQLESMYLEI